MSEKSIVYKSAYKKHVSAQYVYEILQSFLVSMVRIRKCRDNYLYDNLKCPMKDLRK